MKYQITQNFVQIKVKMMFKINLFFSLFIFILTASSQQPQTVQYTISMIQGYNYYIPLQNFYSTSQTIYLSDLLHNQSKRKYHFCFYSESQKQRTQLISKRQIFDRNITWQNYVIYDLQQIFDMDKIIASIYSTNQQIIYLLSSNQIILFKIFKNGTTNKNQTLKLEIQVQRGQLIEVDSKVIALTEKSIFLIQKSQKYHKLTKIITIPENQQSQFTSIINVGRKIFLTKTKSISAYNIIDLNSQKLEKQNLKSFVGFSAHPSSQSFHYYHSETQLLFAYEQKSVLVGFNVNFTTNQSIDRKDFFKLPLSKKCDKAKKWQNYMFFECENHLLYFNTKQMLKCKQTSSFQTQKCLNNLKVNQSYIGFHIQSVQFFGVSTIIVAGIDQSQILQIMFKKDSQTNQRQIISIQRTNTRFKGSKIQHAHLIEPNKVVLVTKNFLSLSKNIPKKYELFCRTVNQNSHTLLDQPSGIYTGLVKVKGLCTNKLQSTYIQNIVDNSNFCQMQITLKIDYVPREKHYKVAWYVLLIIISVFLIFNAVFFFYKKLNLNKQYKIFEDQKQQGQIVLQQTMVTEQNQDLQSKNIDQMK